MDGERHDRLRRALAEHDLATGAAGAVCAVAVRELGADGAAVTLQSENRAKALAAASDDWAASLEELQVTTGEGPGVAVFAAGGPVLVGDLAAAQGRWPGFVDDATAAGLAAAFAFPLRAGSIRMGVLALYRRRPGPLGRDRLADAAVLAELATTAVLADSEASAGDVPDFYESVHIATGMIAVDLRVSLEDALLRLRAHAFAHHLPLHEVADAVLQRQLRFDAR
ncbi:MAG: hypothetical protein QOI78_8942 [Actinomycetota bacterium]|nr:hypothetical protein [Actinomycetota bacterium]